MNSAYCCVGCNIVQSDAHALKEDDKATIKVKKERGEIKLNTRVIFNDLTEKYYPLPRVNIAPAENVNLR